MSGIGDYVHLKNENYKAYGTLRKTDGSSNYGSASIILMAQKEKMRRNIFSSTAKEIDGLESFLQGLLYGSEGNVQGFNNEAFQKYKQAVIEIFEEKYGSLGINFDQGLNVFTKYKNIEDNQKKIRIEQLRGYLDRIHSLIETGSFKNPSSQDNVNLLRQTEQDLRNFLNSHKNENTKYIYFDRGQDQQLISNINKALALQSIPSKLAIGDAGEYFIAAGSLFASQRAKQISIDLIKEHLSKIVVGGQGSSPIIDATNFDSELVDLSQILSTGWKSFNDNSAWKLSTTAQDKMDVAFEWKDNQLAVSMKNYKFKDSSQKVHILSDSSLLYLINNEDSLFINHWLNLLSTTENISDESNNGMLLQKAHEAMKVTILIKALTGSGLGRKNPANTFIINMRSLRKIKVRTMSQLSNAAINMLNAIEFKGYPSSLSQSKVGEAPSEISAKVRITNLLRMVYGCKISVALPSLVFASSLDF